MNLVIRPPTLCFFFQGEISELRRPIAEKFCHTLFERYKIGSCRNFNFGKLQESSLKCRDK